MYKKAREVIDELRLYGATQHGADVRFLDRMATLIVERALREASGQRECVPAGMTAEELAAADDQRRLTLLMGGGN